jgi:hypothetical protein
LPLLCDLRHQIGIHIDLAQDLLFSSGITVIYQPNM